MKRKDIIEKMVNDNLKKAQLKQEAELLNLSIVRQSALKWWNSMTFEEQFYATIKWLSSQKRDTTERHPHHLTGREIQEIHELHSA